ncbi:MAG: efflux RND transporter periplasmic adaptor subunit [Sulfurifustis sp.]
MRWLRYKKTLLAVLLALVAGAAYGIWQVSRTPAPTYRALSVTRGDIDTTVVATGIVQPSNRLEVKPPIAGRVEEVIVREGQRVRRGQVLVWMSSSERAALIDAARAKGPEELKRWEDLYRPTPVIAPIDGTVILRNAEPGQTFQIQDAMLVLSDRLIVHAQVDETDIAQVKRREPARITLDAYPDRPVAGRVAEIAFEAKTVNNVTTYEVDVEPIKVPDFMRSGMTANIAFVVASRHDVLLLPAEAVRMRQGQAQVLVPAGDPKEKPSERDVQLGISDGRRTEVLAGLDEGDKVLVPQLLKPGARAASGSSPLGSPFGGRARR